MIDAAPGHAIEAFTLMGWKAGDAEHEAAGMIGTGEAITCRVQLVPVIVEGEPGTNYDLTDPGAQLPAPGNPAAPRRYSCRLERWRRK